mgnify:CR=1 FL=1
MLPEHSYIINLPHRIDRLRIARSQFAKAGIENFTVFPAIDARKLKITGTMEINQGLIGCFLSHYFILQMALLNGYKRIAVFEDDLILVNDFQKKYDEAMKQVPDKWQLLYLGYYERSGRSKIQVTDNIAIPKNTWGTHAYMLQNEGIKIMFENLQTIKSHIDVQISESIVPKLYTYCISPALCQQSGIKSDIK